MSESNASSCSQHTNQQFPRSDKPPVATCDIPFIRANGSCPGFSYIVAEGPGFTPIFIGSCILAGIVAIIIVTVTQYLAIFIYGVLSIYQEGDAFSLSKVPVLQWIDWIPIVRNIVGIILYVFYYVGRDYLYLQEFNKTGILGPFDFTLSVFQWGVGGVEEGTKFLLALFFLRNQLSDPFKKGSPLAPLVTSLVTAGLGFGIGEAVSYICDPQNAAKGSDFIYLRAIPLPLAHVSWVLLNGMCCRLFRARNLWLLLPGMMLHGYYDTLSIYYFNTFMYWVTLVVPIVVMFLVLLSVKSINAAELRKLR